MVNKPRSLHPAALVVGATAIAAAASLMIGYNVSDRNWSGTATREAAEGIATQQQWIEDATGTAEYWTQVAEDNMATENAYATEQADADATADAESAQAQLDMTATEEAFWVQDATVQAQDATQSAIDEATAVSENATAISLTVTKDYFLEETQYAKFAEHQAATMAAYEATKEAGK